MKSPDPTTFKAPLQFERAAPPASSDQIDSFAAEHGIKLPGDFRAFLQRQDGGVPYPDCLTARDLKLVVKEFFLLAELRSMYLPGVIEFARSPFGDDYAISCRRADFGCIYFIDHEVADPNALSLRLTAAWRVLPARFAVGFTGVADSFTTFIDSLHFEASDWIEYLLCNDPQRFRQFVEEVGVDFKDSIGTPVVSIVASYGTVAELEWIYNQGARASDIVCRAVRNTRDPLNVLRFLLGRGEDATFAYQPGKPYPMGYAMKNGLHDIAAVLREHGVPEPPSS